MGGAVAVHVAAARPGIVSVLVMAEGALEGDGETPFGGQPEDEYIGHAFPQLLETQVAEAQSQPTGLRAAHVGITRLIEPRAIFREAVSMEPAIRAVDQSRSWPGWWLTAGISSGELSDPEPVLERDLAAIGVGWKVVPATGHPMGLQNPERAGGRASRRSWPRPRLGA